MEKGERVYSSSTPSEWNLTFHFTTMLFAAALLDKSKTKYYSKKYINPEIQMQIKRRKYSIADSS